MKYEIECGDIPAGYRPVAHRAPNAGDWYLDFRGKASQCKADMGACTCLILEPITGAPLDQPARDEPTEPVKKFLDGLGDEIKDLRERVAALEGSGASIELRTEDAPEVDPQKYGLWGIVAHRWLLEMPFSSAGDAIQYAATNLADNWRDRWRVMPYPEDGGPPLELRKTETAKLYCIRNTATGNLHRRLDNPPHDVVVSSSNRDVIEQIAKTLTGGPFEILEVEVGHD